MHCFQDKSRQQQQSQTPKEKEELDFMFDEELSDEFQGSGRKNAFTEW